MQKITLLLLFVPLLFLACSKEFDPSHPKDGKSVVLYLDHYKEGTNFRVFDNKNRSNQYYTYVSDFPGRELGYFYVINAKVVKTPSGIMDAPSYYFKYTSTIHKYKFEDAQPFNVSILNTGSYPSMSLLSKRNDSLFYDLQYLSPINAAVYKSIDSVYEMGKTVAGEEQIRTRKLTVKHDPGNFGKGFIVYGVQ
ncbi:hypothetical protein LX64_03285 [Chitinophaga skermanii]|uniref:NigD-like protein n=1 Tax=Chitinophaga skermanii TaxID=331697 RepID=A0A327QCA0_9BACT|nr:hypothetical protein [Chitinophaga skermanii]RAJ02276.1 hypothetical protein LX64_03285 [Chitinophaga skermanii]